MKMHLIGLVSTLVFFVACKSTDKSSLSADSAASLSCRIAPNCNQALPKLPKPTGFKKFYNKVLSKVGRPVHRARDVLAVEGAPIHLHAKFTYGLLDSDLKEENVDIYLSQGCTAPWQKLGSVTTTKDDQHETVDGIEDSGGRIYAQLSSQKLAVGRHRVLFVVSGDNTMTELFVNVVPRNEKVVVTDIDGTLTVSELAAATEVIGIQPKAHASSAEMLTVLYEKGYSIFYLTARPEWLGQPTRDWLADKGFPPGTIHTTTSKIGAQGKAASDFKIREIEYLKLETGIVPSMAFGNKSSDVEAFSAVGIPARDSYFFKLEGDARGGMIVDDYSELLPDFESLPNVCR